MKLTKSDRALIESTHPEPGAEPAFDLMKACLVWADERPGSLSSAGYELLCDLWVVRAFIHREIPPEKWGLDPAYFQVVWKDAQESQLKWAGFHRMTLSEKDRGYLDRCLEEAYEEEPRR